MTPSTFATRYRVPLGVLIGLVVSAAVLSLYDGHGGETHTGENRGPLLSDCGGPIEALVMHYTSDAAEVVGTAYRDFLGQLPEGVTVYVVCPQQADFDDLRARVGAARCVLEPIVVEHPITPWSRDRWLALTPKDESAPTTLLCPRGEMGAQVWPAREGDQRTGDDLAAALGPGVAALRSNLYFDGGDFVVDERTAFVTPAVFERNFQRTVNTREELIRQLENRLKREIVLFDDAPEYHAGMFMMTVGDGTVLVGDPAAAERLLDGASEIDLAELLPGVGADFSQATIARFEAVVEQCREAGYRVVRVPIVPGRDGRTYLTYLNVILDRRDGRPIVYMPAFDGVELLNQAAADIWTELGYDVRPVDCTACYPHFGSLRCLVNVLRRAE